MIRRVVSSSVKHVPLLSMQVRHSSHGCICGLVRCVSACPARTAHEWESVRSDAFLAPYLGSPWDHIDFMLDLANFREGDKVLDLGAGDGRVLIRAIQRGASLAVGWELSRDVYCVGTEHIERASDELQWSQETRSRIQLLHGDARESCPLDFDITTLFLLPEGLAIVSPWLQAMWKARPRDQVDVSCLSCRHDGMAAGDEEIRDHPQWGTSQGKRVVSQGWPLLRDTSDNTASGNDSAIPLFNHNSRSHSLRLIKQSSIPLTGTGVFLYA